MNLLLVWHSLSATVVPTGKQKGRYLHRNLFYIMILARCEDAFCGWRADSREGKCCLGRGREMLYHFYEYYLSRSWKISTYSAGTRKGRCSSEKGITASDQAEDHSPAAGRRGGRLYRTGSFAPEFHTRGGHQAGGEHEKRRSESEGCRQNSKKAKEPLSRKREGAHY